MKTTRSFLPSRLLNPPLQILNNLAHKPLKHIHTISRHQLRPRCCPRPHPFQRNQPSHTAAVEEIVERVAIPGVEPVDLRSCTGRHPSLQVSSFKQRANTNTNPVPLRHASQWPLVAGEVGNDVHSRQIWVVSSAGIADSVLPHNRL